MRLLRKRQLSIPSKNTQSSDQLWVWYCRYGTTRILVDNNKLGIGWRITPEDREPFVAFRNDVALIAEIEEKHAFQHIRCYQNYMAIQSFRMDTHLTEDQLREVVRLVSLRVGWDEIPTPIEVRSDNHFRDLNQKHNSRWKLGRQ